MRINRHRKQAKAFLANLKTLPFIDIKDEQKDTFDKDKSPYNPEFVEKIRCAEKQKSTVIDPDDIRGSLGL